MPKTMKDGPLCMLLLPADMNTLSGERRVGERGGRDDWGEEKWLEKVWKSWTTPNSWEIILWSSFSLELSGSRRFGKFEQPQSHLKEGGEWVGKRKIGKDKRGWHQIRTGKILAQGAFIWSGACLLMSLACSPPLTPGFSYQVGRSLLKWTMMETHLLTSLKMKTFQTWSKSRLTSWVCMG